MVLNDVDGPLREVLALGDAVQIDEWDVLGHETAHAHVMRVLRIGPAIRVAEVPVGGHMVVVGSSPSCLRGRSRDADRQFTDSGLPDTTRANQPDWLPVDHQTQGQRSPRDQPFRVPARQPLEVGERRMSDYLIAHRSAPASAS